MSQPAQDLLNVIEAQCELRGDNDYTIPEIVDAVLKDHPDVVAEATRSSQRAIVTRAVKSHVAPAASQQPTLPGFDHIPVRIALPADGGGYVYRAAYVCTLDDFQEHMTNVLDANITKAVERRDEFRGAVEELAVLFSEHGVSRICDLPITI